MKPRIDLSLVIPAFNEEHRITPTLAKANEFLATTGLTYEILVVDDGSTDQTAAVVNALAHAIPSLRYLNAGPNRGKGSAVRQGMLAAHGAVRIMYDADGAIAVEELPKLANPVLLGTTDLAIGSRYVDGAAVKDRPPLYRVLWSRLANALVRATLVPGIYDTQCGCKAFSAAAATELFARGRIDRWSFDLEILALAKALGMSVQEVGIQWSDDPRSRVHPLRDLMRAVKEFREIRRNFRLDVYGLPTAKQLSRGVASGHSGYGAATRRDGSSSTTKSSSTAQVTLNSSPAGAMGQTT